MAFREFVLRGQPHSNCHFGRISPKGPCGALHPVPLADPAAPNNYLLNTFYSGLLCRAPPFCLPLARPRQRCDNSLATAPLLAILCHLPGHLQLRRAPIKSNLAILPMAAMDCAMTARKWTAKGRGPMVGLPAGKIPATAAAMTEGTVPLGLCCRWPSQFPTDEFFVCRISLAAKWAKISKDQSIFCWLAIMKVMGANYIHLLHKFNLFPVARTKRAVLPKYLLLSKMDCALEMKPPKRDLLGGRH